ELLSEISRSPVFAKADLRVAPASPGKAERLIPLLAHSTATLYVNLEEASLICKDQFPNAKVAAKAMIVRGASRVLVTDGGGLAAEATADSIVTATPPQVMVTRVTGAGDTFMAAHIVSELRGDDHQTALETALRTAANYVSGKSE
ncbi:MAG: PfkB family carbohydrate kinase, partial [Planktomarina sp.]